MGERVDIGAYEYNETTLLINAPFEYTVGEPVNIEGLVHMGEASTWSWDFNQDGVEDSNQATATYTYNATGSYIIQLTGQIVGRSEKDIVYHTIVINEVATSLSPEPESYFKVYPNPVNSALNIEADKSYNIRLMDLSGRLVFQTRMTGYHQSINTSALPKGIYLIQLSNGQDVFTQKLVKD